MTTTSRPRKCLRANKETPSLPVAAVYFFKPFFILHSVYLVLHKKQFKGKCPSAESVKMQSALSCILCVLIAATFVCAANATFCRAPPDLRHGSHSGRGRRYFRAGSTVTYQCNRGYRLHGWRSTVCYYDRRRGAYWAKPAPMCIRKRRRAYLAMIAESFANSPRVVSE